MAIRRSRKGTKHEPLTTKLKTLDMEIALTSKNRGIVPIGRYISVTNIKWGLNLHECDILAVTKDRWATEIEIKTSKSDTKKDLDKAHQHKSDKIKYLYFALPVQALKDEEWLSYVPEHAGIIIVEHWYYGSYNCTIIRKPQKNKNSRKLTEKEYNKFLRLGCFRIFSLKNKIKKILTSPVK